jgi:glycosyltransferase involved in cell wall biosynthesis
LQKFSILTALFNSGNYLDNYFKNIFSQNILPDEILLIDDGENPKDLNNFINSIKKIYNFQNIILIKNKRNIGLGPSLNIGLKKSSNNLIFRLDVDDTWLPNHTQKMMSLYKKNQNYLIYAESLKHSNLCNFIKCDDFLINENSTIHSSWLINKNILMNFRYRLLNPKIALEDYFTLFWYQYRGYKLKISFDQITTIYNDTPGSLGKKYANNFYYLRNRKKISTFFLLHNLKKRRNFFSKIYFILFQFNLIRIIIFYFWIQDIFKVKKFIIDLKCYIIRVKIIFV